MMVLLADSLFVHRPSLVNLTTKIELLLSVQKQACLVLLFLKVGAASSPVS